MAKARGKGEGSIYRRKDGYWVGSVEAGRDPNTGRRRRLRIVRRTRKEVQHGLDELKRMAADGVAPDTRARTVATYLDWWVDEVMEGRVGEQSMKAYRLRVGRIQPAIGHIRLSRLTVAHCQQLARQLEERFAPATAGSTMTTLRSALHYAVGAGLIGRNPADYVSMRRRERARTDDALTLDEAKAVLRAAAGDPLEALWHLALRYGLRSGELVRLRWSDVSTDGLTVRKAKTRAGERTVPMLASIRAQLEAHRGRSGVTEGDGPVFARPDGRPFTTRMLHARWNDLLERARVEHACSRCGSDEECSGSVRRFHIARHTAATLLLEADVPLEVVSAILGHSSIQITADVYGKVRADRKRKGLAVLDEG